MAIKLYQVTCMVCDKSESISIDDNRNILWEAAKFIISGRYRLDMQWGWQCMCGNNDLITVQERDTISNLVNPDPKDIAKVLQSIRPDAPKFRMETV